MCRIRWRYLALVDAALFLALEHGETTAATLVGPVVNGRFVLRTEQGDRLEGTAEDGRLHAFWVDQENWGGYSGGLNGTRT